MRDVVDVLLTQLREPSTGTSVVALVRAELGDDTAVRALLAEAAGDGVSERTRQRVVLALEEAIERHPAFGRALRESVDGGGAPVPVVATVTMGMSAFSPVADAVVAGDVDVVTDLFFGRDDAEHDLADGLLRAGLSHSRRSEEVRVAEGSPRLRTEVSVPPRRFLRPLLRRVRRSAPARSAA